MRSRKRGFSFGGLRALQAFPNTSQTFPNPGPFSPNISKDSFGRFVGNQRLAGRKRKFSPRSKFLRRSACESPAGAAGKADMAGSDMN
jgi:hypothetical protein